MKRRIEINARHAACMGLLFALAIALSALEGMLPAFLPAPGIKPGLSNIVTMYCVFLLGAREAFALAALKAVFALLARGATGALLSLCGGMLSVCAMLLVSAVFARRASCGAVSMAGAVAHNLGQLAAASLLLRLPALWRYTPALVVSGVLMGMLTAALLKAAMPLLSAAAGKQPQLYESKR